MARKHPADVEELLERAGAGADHPANEVEPEKRYVFRGDVQPRAPGYAIRQNKRGIRRRTSTFNIILILFGSAVAIILYIGNIITVNQLAVEVGQLQTKLEKIQNTNAVLQAEVNRKSGWERIGKIAGEQFGLKYPKEQPVWFEVDREKIESLE